jgi:hypothetical protein
MALSVLYSTGFEAANWSNFYLLNGWADYGFDPVSIEANPANVHQTLAGYGGSYSLLGFGGFSCWRTPQVTTAARWYNSWIYWRALPNSLQMSFVDASGNYQAAVVFSHTSGAISFYCDGVAKATSASGIVAPGDKMWVAVYYVADAVAGRCDVYLNGTLVLTFTGDTTNAGTSGWTSVLYGTWAAPIPGLVGYGQFLAYLDDVVITDDGGATPPIPESYSVAIVPDGPLVPSAQLGLTPNGSAENYQNVNAIPSQQTDNNSAAASGDQDLYTLGALTNSPSAVYAVSVFAQAARDGAITNAEVSLDAGAGADYGTPFALPASPAYAVVSRHLAQNPNGGGSWTVGAVNSLQVGIRFTI